jgi:hypothetical protein
LDREQNFTGVSGGPFFFIKNVSILKDQKYTLLVSQQE